MKSFDRINYMSEWFQTTKYTSRLVWFRKYSGGSGWKRLMKRQMFWLSDQNAGDYLSRIVVTKAARHLGLKSMRHSEGIGRLLAIGSILHYARDGDVIWGTGVNGKVKMDKHRFTQLDVRMVRGPLTRKFLTDRGISVEPLYGDPALLLPYLCPEYTRAPVPGKIILIPNINDLPFCNDIHPNSVQLISPMMHWKSMLAEILTSELVITSSLHGIVLSEAFGVPVRFVMPVGGETLFKYRDYYQGTGRDILDVPKAITGQLGPESGVSLPPPVYDVETMLGTFPRDLYRQHRS